MATGALVGPLLADAKAVVAWLGSVPKRRAHWLDTTFPSKVAFGENTNVGGAGPVRRVDLTLLGALDVSLTLTAATAI